MSSELPVIDNAVEYTVALICSPSKAHAAKLCLTEPLDKQCKDGSQYTTGKIFVFGDRCYHKAVIAVSPVNRLLENFVNIRFALMVVVGYAGSSTKPGDVVVGSSCHLEGGVFRYNHEETSRRKQFSEIDTSDFIRSVLGSALGVVEASLYLWPDAIREIRDTLLSDGKNLVKSQPLNLHYGLIASADVPLDPELRKELTTGTAIACFAMVEPALMEMGLPFRVICGVCDETEGSQTYAAIAAAAAAKYYLSRIPPLTIIKPPMKDGLASHRQFDATSAAARPLNRVTIDALLDLHPCEKSEYESDDEDLASDRDWVIIPKTT